MNGPDGCHTKVTELMLRALTLADAAAWCDIEAGADRVQFADGLYWDLRPMLDTREHAPEVIDLNQLSIDYALQRGMVRRHPLEPHLVQAMYLPSLLKGH